MKTPRIANAVGNIDDDLIARAENSKKKTKHNSWLKWGSIAACFALVVVAIAMVAPMMQSDDPGVELGDQVRPYKDVTVQGESAYYEWRWEYKTVEEKYTAIDVDGNKFSGRQKEISSDHVGEKLGVYEATGYDTYSEEYHKENFDVYSISGISAEAFIAVFMEGKYFVFFTDEKTPPATFGEVMDTYNLLNTIDLNRFSLEEQDREVQYFNLGDDNYIWEQLSDCRNAASIVDDKWLASERDYISFTITSETLGVYKRALYITKDGYLWTNVFDVAHLYNIGEDVASNIMNYALEEATPGESLPFMYSLAGTITEIGVGYILLDDSIMCVDPEDGITYKIITTAPKLSRFFDTNRLEVGDTVQVSYMTYVDLVPNAVIDSAETISKATIVDGTAIMPG